MVSSTSLAANGADLSGASDVTYYTVFIAPVNITAVNMHIYVTESYSKDTTDAKISLATEADTPVTVFTYTLNAAGVAARTFISDTPESGKASIAAGTALNLVITVTGTGTGTGHAKVWLEYQEA